MKGLFTVFILQIIYVICQNNVVNNQNTYNSGMDVLLEKEHVVTGNASPNNLNNLAMMGALGGKLDMKDILKYQVVTGGLNGSNQSTQQNQMNRLASMAMLTGKGDKMLDYYLMSNIINGNKQNGGTSRNVNSPMLEQTNQMYGYNTGSLGTNGVGTNVGTGLSTTSVSGSVPVTGINNIGITNGMSPGVGSSMNTLSGANTMNPASLGLIVGGQDLVQDMYDATVYNAAISGTNPGLSAAFMTGGDALEDFSRAQNQINLINAMSGKPTPTTNGVDPAFAAASLAGSDALRQYYDNQHLINTYKIMSGQGQNLDPVTVAATLSGQDTTKDYIEAQQNINMINAINSASQPNASQPTGVYNAPVNTPIVNSGVYQQPVNTANLTPVNSGVYQQPVNTANLTPVNNPYGYGHQILQQQNPAANMAMAQMIQSNDNLRDMYLFNAMSGGNTASMNDPMTLAYFNENIGDIPAYMYLQQSMPVVDPNFVQPSSPIIPSGPMSGGSMPVVDPNFVQPNSPIIPSGPMTGGSMAVVDPSFDSNSPAIIPSGPMTGTSDNIVPSSSTGTTFNNSGQQTFSGGSQNGNQIPPMAMNLPVNPNVSNVADPVNPVPVNSRSTNPVTVQTNPITVSDNSNPNNPVDNSSNTVNSQVNTPTNPVNSSTPNVPSNSSTPNIPSTPSANPVDTSTNSVSTQSNSVDTITNVDTNINNPTNVNTSTVNVDPSVNSVTPAPVNDSSNNVTANPTDPVPSDSDVITNPITDNATDTLVPPTGKCVGEIQSKDEECGAINNQEDCEKYGRSVFSDGVCDWNPVDSSDSTSQSDVATIKTLLKKAHQVGGSMDPLIIASLVNKQGGFQKLPENLQNYMMYSGLSGGPASNDMMTTLALTGGLNNIQSDQMGMLVASSLASNSNGMNPLVAASMIGGATGNSDLPADMASMYAISNMLPQGQYSSNTMNTNGLFNLNGLYPTSSNGINQNGSTPTTNQQQNSGNVVNPGVSGISQTQTNLSQNAVNAQSNSQSYNLQTNSNSQPNSQNTAPVLKSINISNQGNNPGMNNLLAYGAMDGGDGLGTMYLMNELNQNSQAGSSPMNNMLPLMAMDMDMKDAVVFSSLSNSNRNTRGSGQQNMMNGMLPLIAMDGEVKDALMINALSNGSGGMQNRGRSPVLQKEHGLVGDKVGAMYMMNQLNQNQGQNQGTNSNGNVMNNILPVMALGGDIKDAMWMGALSGGFNGQSNGRNGQNNNMGQMLPFLALDGEAKDAFMINAMSNRGRGSSQQSPMLKSTHTEQTATNRNQPPRQINPLESYVAMEMLDGDAAEMMVAEQMLSGTNPSLSQELMTLEMIDADAQDVLVYEAAAGRMNQNQHQGRSNRPYSALKKTHSKNEENIAAAAASLNVPKKNEIIVWMVPLAVLICIGSIILFICILNSIVGKRKKRNNADYKSILNDDVVSK